MDGFTAKRLAGAASLALTLTLFPSAAAYADGEAGDEITEPVTVVVPAQICSDQNDGSGDTAASECNEGDSAIGDQENEGNGNFTDISSHNGNEQGNDQLNDQGNDQLQGSGPDNPERDDED